MPQQSLLLHRTHRRRDQVQQRRWLDRICHLIEYCNAYPIRMCSIRWPGYWPALRDSVQCRCCFLESSCSIQGPEAIIAVIHMNIYSLDCVRMMYNNVGIDHNSQTSSRFPSSSWCQLWAKTRRMDVKWRFPGVCLLRLAKKTHI